MHGLRITTAAALALLALTACSSSADDRAEACVQAYENLFDAEGMKGISSFDEQETGDGRYELRGHADATNGLGEPVQIQIVCTMDANGEHVEIKTDPSFSD